MLDLLTNMTSYIIMELINLEINMILCGAKQIDITPNIGIELGGYGARVGKSKGIHDPLFAQVVYLCDSTTELMLIGMDLLAVDAEFTQQLRSKIHELTHVLKDAILVSCTHTHSGPDGYALFPPTVGTIKNQQQRMITFEKIAGAAQWAKESAEEVTFSYAVERVKGIGTNRNDDNEPIDDEINILRIDKNDQPYALVVNYGCHPTVMGAKNLLISADLPGAARKYLEKLYPSIVMMFFNGGAGNVSTRFTRRSQGFEELDRFGLILYSDIIGAMQVALPVDVQRLKFMRQEMPLKIRDLPSQDEALKLLTQFENEYQTNKENQVQTSPLRVAETKVQGARRLVQLSDALHDVDFITSEMQVMRLGEVILLTIPGEPYTEISQAIKSAFQDQKIMVIGYANDYQGYFTMGVQSETYETLKSPWPADIGERIVEKSILLIENVLRD